jgi:hypothetical protein
MDVLIADKNIICDGTQVKSTIDEVKLQISPDDFQLNVFDIKQKFV